MLLLPYALLSVSLAFSEVIKPFALSASSKQEVTEEACLAPWTWVMSSLREGWWGISSRPFVSYRFSPSAVDSQQLWLQSSSMMDECGASSGDGSGITDSGISSSSSIATVTSEKLLPPTGAAADSRLFHVGRRCHHRRHKLVPAADADDVDDDNDDSAVNLTDCHHRCLSDDGQKCSDISVLRPSPAGLISTILTCISNDLFLGYFGQWVDEQVPLAVITNLPYHNKTCIGGDFKFFMFKKLAIYVVKGH